MTCLPKRGLQERRWIRDQKRTPRLERLGVLDADEAPNVLALDPEPFQTRGLRPAEDGPVLVDGRGLSLIGISHINREIEFLEMQCWRKLSSRAVPGGIW